MAGLMWMAAERPAAGDDGLMEMVNGRSMGWAL